MSSFSFSYTAPAVSEEQERAELEALTDAERRELQADLRPDDDSVTSARSELQETEEQTARAVAMLKEAVLQLPEKETSAYKQALEQAPDLVERECDPVAFLRCERWDIWAASKRFALYWKVRRHLFGESSFLLPMTLDGAMADDVPTLEKGVIVVLPPDKFDRPICFFDRSRVKKNGEVDPKSVARCMFYTRSVMAESPVAQTLGCVVVVYARRVEMFIHHNRKFALDLAAVRDASPGGKGATTHVLLRVNDEFSRKVVLPVIKFIFGKNWRQRLVIHSGPDLIVQRELAEFGIPEESRNCVEQSSLRTAHLEQWLRERRALERSRMGR